MYTSMVPLCDQDTNACAAAVLLHTSAALPQLSTSALLKAAVRRSQGKRPEASQRER